MVQPERRVLFIYPPQSGFSLDNNAGRGQPVGGAAYERSRQSDYYRTKKKKKKRTK